MWVGFLRCQDGEGVGEPHPFLPCGSGSAFSFFIPVIEYHIIHTFCSFSLIKTQSWVQ
jgi:hypothetical protein